MYLYYISLSHFTLIYAKKVCIYSREGRITKKYQHIFSIS